MARASLRIEGQREAARLVDEVGQRARRPEPALSSSDVLTVLQEGQRRRFSHARGWPRVTAEWAARKRRTGLDPRTMRASGNLESQLVNAGPDTQHSAFNMEMRWGLKWRATAFYAADQARNHRRRAVVIDTAARRAITRLVQDYIAGAWSP